MPSARPCSPPTGPDVRLGITLSTFHSEPRRVLRQAAEAEAAGLDGVFLFDHLWHIGRPDRPALHGPTLMGAVAASTRRLVVGSLVARIGLQPNAVLAALFATLNRMAPGRIVAGLGVGDGLSRDENEAYGIEFAHRPARLSQLIECARLVRASGVPVWVGGTSAAIWELAAGEADAVNLWDAELPAVSEASLHVAPAAVTWAGLARGELAGPGLGAHMEALARAGVQWAIYAPVGGEEGLVHRMVAAREKLSP